MMAGGVMPGGMIRLAVRETETIFVIAGEYSANPRHLPPSRRGRAFLAQPHPELTREEVTRLFFRYPNRSEDGRTKPEDWKREFGLDSPVGLTDLFASAAHRALT